MRHARQPFATAVVVFSLFVLSVSGLSSHVFRQAKREEIVGRKQLKYRAVRPRASPTPCIDGVETSDSDCCPTQSVYQTGCLVTGPKFCCTGGTVYASSTNFQSCCVGVTYPSPNQGPLLACCDSASQLTTDGATCCPYDQEPSGNICVNREIAKRHGSQTKRLTKRSGSDRILLESQMVAEYLVNNGIFTYDGASLIDQHHRNTNERMLNRLLGKGFMAAMKYVSPTEKGVADVIDTMPYYPLSATYEFALADAPDIYARIVADPQFTHFHWQGASFDKKVLHRLVSPHPNFNETLVEVYAAQYK